MHDLARGMNFRLYIEIQDLDNVVPANKPRPYQSTIEDFDITPKTSTPAGATFFELKSNAAS
jgi:hypothetical protein